MGDSPAQGAPGARVLEPNAPTADAPSGPSGDGNGGALPSFGRFELTERIGAGGMAEVFRAEVRGPEDFRRELVIKRVLPRLSAEPRFTHMFVNEAKISAMLSHPNIVQIFEFGAWEGIYFIAMESVRGFTLREALTRLRGRGARMPVVAALHIARELLVALDYAHNLVDHTGRRLEIVHRDISPSNVMLANNGAVKVLDFGIARAADLLEAPDPGERGGPLPGGTTSAPARSLLVKGKVPYLAPEQLSRGSLVDHRVDVFAVGCVLFEMLAGRPLFRCHNDLAKKLALLQHPCPIPSTFNADVALAVDAIVARSVERNPEARYASAGEMLAEVENHLASLRAPSRAILRLVRSLDERSDASTSETFLTASARWVRPTIAGESGTPRPTEASADAPKPKASTNVGPAASLPAGAEPATAVVPKPEQEPEPERVAHRRGGRRRSLSLAAAVAALLLGVGVGVGVGAHAVAAAYRSRRAHSSQASERVGPPARGTAPPEPGSLVLRGRGRSGVE